MTDDRSIERAARSWLEEGPTQAPDHAVEAALTRIQSTNQERDWPVPWRTRPMIQTLKLVAGAAALAVVVGGVILLRPGSGPGIGGPSSAPIATPSPIPSATSTASPSASGPLTACGLLTTDEVKDLGGNASLGALPSESGSGAVTTCLFSDGGGNVIVRLTYTTSGGRAAFDAAKSVAGVEVVNDIGTDAVFDPASKTLYVAKGDAMVAIVASVSPLDPVGGVYFAAPYGRLIAPRM
jgi:hypothetical protein